MRARACVLTSRAEGGVREAAGGCNGDSVVSDVIGVSLHPCGSSHAGGFSLSAATFSGNSRGPGAAAGSE